MSTERETTRGMVRRLIEVEAQEPQGDAGSSPILEHHERAGREWADWDRQRRAWVALLAPRLLAEAIEDAKAEEATA